MEHHRNTNKHETHKNLTGVKPLFRSSFHSPFFSKSSPTSHLQFSCEVEPWAAVLPSGQGMQSTAVSFLKWSGGHISHWVPWPFLSCSNVAQGCFAIIFALNCRESEQHWANKRKKIWQPAGVKIQIILNPDLCSSDSSQGCSYTVCPVQTGWVWLPAGCWWDQNLWPKSEHAKICKNRC